MGEQVTLRRTSKVPVDPEHVAAMIPVAAVAAFPPEDYRDYFNRLTDEVEEITGVRDPSLTMEVALLLRITPADWIKAAGWPCRQPSRPRLGSDLMHFAPEDGYHLLHEQKALSASKGGEI